MSDIDSNLPDRDASDGASGSTSPSLTTQIGGTDGTNLRTLLTDSTGKLLLGASTASIGAVTFGDVSPANQTITALDTGTSNLSGANGQVFYFSTPTTNSAASFILSSEDTVVVQGNLLGSGGTMVVEVSADNGSFWIRPNVYQPSTQFYTNGFTSPFIAVVNVSGMTNIRVRSTVSWSGTATIIVHRTLNNRLVTIGDALPTGTNSVGQVTANAGTNLNTSALALDATIIGGNQRTKITDGTNNAAVKAASTTAVATDPALVVAISPNNSITVKAQLQDNAGTGLTSTLVNSNQSLDVNITKLVTATDNNGSGNISSLNGTVSASVNGCSTITFNTLGTWVATITLEATVDNSNWFIINGDIDINDTISTSFTSNTFITVPCGSFLQVRLRATSYTSGTAAITWVASIGSNIQEIFNTTAASLKATVNLQDGNGNIITSTAQSANKQALDVTHISSATNYYSAPVNIRQSATTATNATVWAMRNPSASTKTIFLERIFLIGDFDSGTPLGRTLQAYNLVRFTTATPTAGTAITVVAQDSSNASTAVTDVRFVDTGLTTTGISFGTAFATIGIPSSDGATVQYLREGIALKLAAGEGFCIRLGNTAVVGQGITGEVVWSER